MNYKEMTIEELNAELEAKLHSCAMWKSTTDGSYEMALHRSGYYEVMEVIKLKNSGRISELEEFLEVARIPDAQEWHRQELRGES